MQYASTPGAARFGHALLYRETIVQAHRLRHLQLLDRCATYVAELTAIGRKKISMPILVSDGRFPSAHHGRKPSLRRVPSTADVHLLENLAENIDPASHLSVQASKQSEDSQGTKDLFQDVDQVSG